MSFLKGMIRDGVRRGVRNGISQGIGQAVGNAVNRAVAPTAERYADRAAEQLNEAAGSMSRQMAQDAGGMDMQTAQSAGQYSGGFAGLEGALGNLQRSMESYATEAGKNAKVCPGCGAVATADKRFCPSCGAKLPEQTLAQGAVCPGCGKQNSVGTRFCTDCGAKLPAAIAEEQAAADKAAAVLAQWDAVIPQYPKWTLGGDSFELESGDGYTRFSATFATAYAAQRAVEQYRDILLQNGFRQAGQYPSIDHLYKRIGGICYDADTEHCFEGDSETADFYFIVREPEGGFDYVKPQPQPKQSFFDLFK